MPHVLSFPLTLEILSQDQKGADVTAEMLVAALEQGLARAKADPEALLAEFAQLAVPQQRWALASATRPDVIMKADRRWVWITHDTIDPADLFTSDAAMARPLPADCVWRLPEHLGTVPVLAEICSDDRAVDRIVDVTPWLASADPESIAELCEEPSFGDASDRVARELEDLGEPSARALFTYLSFDPSNHGEKIGFSVDAAGSAVGDWLRANRPDALPDDPDLDIT